MDRRDALNERMLHPFPLYATVFVGPGMFVA